MWMKIYHYPMAFWDYLMDDFETSSSIFEEIILSPSPTPTTTSTTTNTTIAARTYLSLEDHEEDGGRAAEGSSSQNETKKKAKTNTETLEEKLLALGTGRPNPALSSSPLPFTSKHGGCEEKKAVPDLSVEDIEHANHDDLDAILAKQMEQLSMNKRMKYKKEIHGIHDDETIDETPDFIEAKLEEMEDCR